MISCGHLNVRKHKEIKNGEQYIALDISSEIGCLDKRKFTSSGPRDYVGRPGERLTTSLTLRTRNSPKSEQKAKVVTNDVCLQSFVEILEGFKDVTYQRYMRKEVKNKTTDTY